LLTYAPYEADFQSGSGKTLHMFFLLKLINKVLHLLTLILIWFWW